MTCKTEVSLRVGSVLGCKGFPSPPGEHDQSCIRQGGAGLIMYRSGDLEINFRLVGEGFRGGAQHPFPGKESQALGKHEQRSGEHTSELQSLMRNSYAVCGLDKKHTHSTYTNK